MPKFTLFALFFLSCFGSSILGTGHSPIPATAESNYKEYCASCHGSEMQAFVDRKWEYGQTEADLVRGIKDGYPDDGMPAYDTTFTEKEIIELAQYISTGLEEMTRYDFADQRPASDTFSTSALSFHLDTVAFDLDTPWGMAFLPDNSMLFTTLPGKLYHLDNARKITEIRNVPEVKARGQGGLMDIDLHPDFENNNFLYLTYSKPGSGSNSDEATTAVMRARLQNNRIVDEEVIFEALPYASTRHHFGSRLEFDKEGYLFLSVGDRGNRTENPQSLDNHCGKIHRIHDDGTIPPDNPFVNSDTAMASIWSFGHRNPQGLTMHPQTGAIWEHEHGPRGGDEVNIIRKGHNYGWPVISYGINYNGTTFTEKTSMSGMDQPQHYWIPSIAPCGMDFVTGDRYPGWEGNLMVGSLRYEYLNRCVIRGDKIVEEEILMENIGRVRQVQMGPDDYIYLAVESPGAIYRLLPLP